MPRCRICVALVAAAALGAMAAPVRAQIDTSKPIVIKTIKPKTKLEKFQGEVMHANPVAITVRSRENERVIRTFTYSAEVRDRMQQIIDLGGYQYGDKVEIQCEAGGNVALRIKGKPSKPL
jgi:hypothetical protein